MEKNKLIVGNQKMYMTISEVSDYIKKINDKVLTDDVVICPSAIYVPYFLKHKYSVGVQNVCYEDAGAFTGEVSAKQANGMGIKYAIVGHSERRKYFNEDNEIINKKIKVLLENNITPILCIGETNEEKNLLKTEKVLKQEIVGGLNGISVDRFKDIVIAYEPIWAIGTHRTPTVAEIKKNVQHIKNVVKKIYKTEIRVLYGGSVNSENIKKLNQINVLDGFLIGGSSTNAEEFLKIIEVVVNQ